MDRPALQYPVPGTQSPSLTGCWELGTGYWMGGLKRKLATAYWPLATGY